MTIPNYNELVSEVYANVLGQLEEYSKTDIFSEMEEFYAFKVDAENVDELLEARESEELEDFDEEALVIGSDEVSELSNRKIKKILKNLMAQLRYMDYQTE